MTLTAGIYVPAVFACFEKNKKFHRISRILDVNLLTLTILYDRIEL